MEIKMMETLSHNLLPIPSKRTIKAFEDEFELLFPMDYVQFIQKNNGVIPITNKFKFNNYEYLIEKFLCLLTIEQANSLAEGCYDIGTVALQLEERLTINEEDTSISILPIVSLFAGDFVCLDFRYNLKNPTICIWYHEDSEEFSPKTATIANSFNDFLNMLY